MVDLVERLPFISAWFLVVVGLVLMARTTHLVKQLVGLYFVQSAIILFFMSLSVKGHSTVPILEHGAHVVNAAHYANPLPHVLMLTAIVVGVATQGVAFVLIRRIFRAAKTLDTQEFPSSWSG